MPLDDLEPRLLEQIGGDAAFQAPPNGDVIGRIARIQSVQKPESFLRGGAREIGALRGLASGRGTLIAAAGSKPLSGLLPGRRIQNPVRRLRHGSKTLTGAPIALELSE